MRPTVRLVCRTAVTACVAFVGCAGITTAPRTIVAASSNGHTQNSLLLASSSGSLYAHTQSNVSLGRGWQHVPMDAPGLTQNYAKVAAGGPGVIAFAPGRPGTPTRLWASADGRTWRSLPSPNFGRGAAAWSLYATGKILVITGSAGSSPRIWVSHDGGATWHASPAHLRFTALAAGGDGVVAFSLADVSHPIRVWTSADGLRWRQLPQPHGVFANGLVSSVARGVHGLVAGGVAASSSLPSVTAGIWTSPDGRTWRQVPNAGRIFGNGSDESQVISIVAGPRGILGIGQGPVRQTVAWASPDGLHWRRGPAPFSEPPGSSGDLVAWQQGFVHVSDESGETAIWSSAGGLTWTRVGSDELFGGTARVKSATAFRGGVVAVGSFALHPRPACLRYNTAVLNDLRAFHPAAFLWSPVAGSTAPPPTTDRADPRTFNLFPSDGITANGPSAYVNLCALDPVLGPHRAYQVLFFDPGETYGGEALSIVAQSPRAATVGFRQVDSFFGLGVGTIQHKRELSSQPRIGQETRVFQLGVQFWEPPHNPFTQFAVGWRQGQAIGVVETGTQHEAITLAERQLAHLQHPGRDQRDGYGDLRPGRAEIEPATHDRGRSCQAPPSLSHR